MSSEKELQFLPQADMEEHVDMGQSVELPLISPKKSRTSENFITSTVKSNSNQVVPFNDEQRSDMKAPDQQPESNDETSNSSDQEDRMFASNLLQKKQTDEFESQEFYDPFQELDHLSQLKTDYDLNSSTIIPFDQVKYIQVLFNPQSEGKDREIITVQKYNPSVHRGSRQMRERRMIEDLTDEANKYRFPCPQGHNLHFEKLKEELVCTFCEEECLKVYRCKEGCKFLICQDCNLKAYRRKALQKQTSILKFYKEYQLEAALGQSAVIEEANEDKQQPLSTIEEQEEAEKRQKLQDLQFLIKQGKAEATEAFYKHENDRISKLVHRENEIRAKADIVRGTRFANVKEIKRQDAFFMQDTGYKKYLIVGFWRVESDGQYRCYRMFKILKPLCQKYSQGGREITKFFYQGPNKSLYFFQASEQQTEVRLHFCDLSKAMGPENLLRKANVQTFKLPTLPEFFTVSEEQPAYGLLKLLCGVSDTDRQELLRAEPVYFQHNSTDYLMITAPFIMTTGGEREWLNTKKCWAGENLVVFNLKDKNQNICQVPQVDCVLQLPTSETSDVFLLRKNEIIQMPWVNLMSEEVAVAKEQVLFGFTPIHTTGRVFRMLPSHQANYCWAKKDLEKALNQARAPGSLVAGRLHGPQGSKNRASIIYGKGGLFNFEIHRANDTSSEANWEGEVGELRNFQLRLKFEGSSVSGYGKDNIKGSFNASGKVESSFMKWAGFKQSTDKQKDKKALEFNNVCITADGSIKGAGVDGDDNYQISGHFFQDTKQVHLERTYEGRHRNVKFIFEGFANKENSIWLGEYRKEKGGIEVEKGKFKVRVSKMQNLSLTVVFKQRANRGGSARVHEQSQIKLTGVYDRTNSILKGTFKTSSDLTKLVCVEPQNPDSARNSFSLFAPNLIDRAELIYRSYEFADGEFSQYKPGETWVCGRMREKKLVKEKIEGYKSLNFQAINLDTGKFGTEPEILRLTCQIQNAMQEVVNSMKKVSLPYYYLMPFSIWTNPQGEITWRSQLFFHDDSSKQLRLTFLQGRQIPPAMEQEDLQQYLASLRLPQMALKSSDNYSVQYPVLAYKSPLPSDTEIAICSLIRNEPQKFISIKPYRFVRFVEMGLNPERHFSKKNSAEQQGSLNTTIYFLVERDQKYFLMYYRTFPYPVDLRRIDPMKKGEIQRQDQIMLVSGCIDLREQQNHVDCQYISSDKIRRASVLVRQGNTGNQMMFILQCNDQIYVFNANKNQKDPSSFQRVQSGQRMVEQAMQRSPGGHIYFIEENEVGVDTLVQIKFVERDTITKSVVFRCDDFDIQAVQVQLDSSNNHYTTDDIPHILLLFTSNNKIKQLKYSDEKFEFIGEIDLTFHPDIPQLSRRMQGAIWQNIIIGTNCLYGQIQNEKNPNELKTVVYSTFSELSQGLIEIGFQDDRRYGLIQDNRADLKRIHQTTTDLDAIPWIGKVVFVVQEAKNSFFRVMQDHGTRRIDMTRADTQLYGREAQFLIGNCYVGLKLRFCNQILLYDQKELTFRKAFNQRILIPLTAVEEGDQFFAADNPNHDQPLCDRVIHVNSLGKIRTLYQNVLEFMETAQTEVFGDRQITYPKKSWALNLNNQFDLALCIFAFQYDSETQQLSQSQAKDDNNDSAKNVDISNQITLQVIPVDLPDEGDLNLSQGSQVHSQSMKVVNKRETLLGADLVFAKSVMNRNEQAHSSRRKTAAHLAKTMKSPQLFVIKSSHFEETADIQVYFTEDFLVIRHAELVCWTEIKRIDQMLNNLPKKLFGLDRQDRFEQLLVDPGCRVPFNCLDIDNISYNIMRNGCCIRPISRADLNILDKTGECQNAIQISFSDISVAWNLDKNWELTFITKLDQFATQKSYTPTGFVPHLAKDNASKLMDEQRFFLWNEDQSLVLTPDTKQRFSCFIRTYAGINLLDVIDIRNRIADNKVVRDTAIMSMLQNYDGLTFFHIFKDHPYFIDKLIGEVKAKGLEQLSETDEMGNITDHINIRQIYWLLQTPELTSADLRLTPINRPNLIQQCIFNRKYHFLIDKCIELMMLSSEYRFTDFIGNYACFEKIFEISSNKILLFLEEAHIESTESLEVDSVLWDPQAKLITFGTNHSLMSARDIVRNVQYQQVKAQGMVVRTFRNMYAMCRHELMTNPLFDPEELLMKEKRYRTTRVRVRILEIDWLADHLRPFYNFLNKVDDSEMFGNEFIKILLQQQNYSTQLVFKVFVPWLFFMICNLVYFTHYVPKVEVNTFFGREEDGDRDQGIIRALILLNVAVSSALELRQIFRLTLVEYAKDFWNQVIWVNFGMSVLIVLAHGLKWDYEHNQLVWLCSIATVSQWAMVYYWLRLFPQLAFYVTMIYETIKDIGWFMITFLLCITVFANAYVVLNMTQPPEGEDPYDQLWDDAFNDQYADSFFAQYLVGLGEWNIDSFQEHPRGTTALIYFILATLFTQILFMNMLIAIMGETYSRVSEAQERTQLMERSHLYADYIWAIRLTSELQGKRYLYVVKPVESQDDDMAALLKSETSEIKQQIAENNQATSEQIQSMSHKLQNVVALSHKVRMELSQQIEDSNREMKSLINEKFEKVMQKLK